MPAVVEQALDFIFIFFNSHGILVSEDRCACTIAAPYHVDIAPILPCTVSSFNVGVSILPAIILGGQDCPGYICLSVCVKQ